MLVLLLAAPALSEWFPAVRGPAMVNPEPGGSCRLEGDDSSGIRCVLMGFLIPVNRAQAVDFTVVPGIGPVLAERIVVVRRELGGFSRLDDLERVPGIGPKRLSRLRRYLTLD